MATNQPRLQPSQTTESKRRGLVPPPSETASSVISFAQTQETLNVGKNVCFENTYRTKPKEGTKFKESTVSKAAFSVLESYLCDVTYEPKRCSELSRELSELIMCRVKELGFPRYKLVCFVSIGQNTGQGVAIASRALWDTETDSYASITYRNKELFAVVTVYGMYFE